MKEFAEMCLLFFSKKLDDTLFMSELAFQLDFETVEELLEFPRTDKTTLKKRGRPLSNKADRMLMYNFWKEHSEVNNDRRNGRHVIKVKPSKLDVALSDLVGDDDNIKIHTTKGGEQLKAQKYIYTHTVRMMHKMFREEHPDIRCSATIFYRC